MIELLQRDHQFSLQEREAFFHEVKQKLNDKYVLLKTCNRVEAYLDGMAANKCYSPVSHETVFHLFSLTSGLNSVLVGENQILHQVKTAYHNALSEGRTSKTLNLLFQWALKAGKRVRSETDISKGALSHSQCAVEALKLSGLNLSSSRILVIGINHLNRKIIQYLVKNGAGTILIGNRTYERAKVFEKELGCRAFKFDRLKEHLAETDILITATSAPHSVVKPGDLPPNKNMFIIDLAFPCDVDPSIGGYPGIKLLNIEDIEKLITRNMDSRNEERLKGQAIIKEESEKFLGYLEKRQCSEQIKI